MFGRRKIKNPPSKSNSIMKIIEVNMPTFFYNKQNPELVCYEIFDKNEWVPIMVEIFRFGFPKITENQILFKLKKSSNRGYILNK